MKNKILNFFDYDLKVLFKNASWQFSSQLIVSLMTFLKVIVISRNLSLGDYGSYVMILAFLSIIHFFFRANVGTATIKFCSDFRHQGKDESILALVKLNFLLLSGLAVLYVATVAILGEFLYTMFFKQDELYIYLLLFALVLSFEYYGEIFIALLRFYDKFKHSAIIYIVTAIIELIILWIIVLNTEATFSNIFIAIIIAKSIAVFLRLLFSWYVIRDKYKGFFNVPVLLVREDLKRYFSFVFNNSLTRLVASSSKKGDVLILGYFVGSESVAVYDIAKKLAFMFHTIRGPLEISIMPQLAKMVSVNKFNDLKIFLFKLTKISLVMAVLVYGVFYFISEDLILMIFGEQYAGAKNYFVILMAAVLIELAFFWIAPIYTSLGKVKERLKIVTFSIIFAFSLSYFFITFFGPIGMSYVMLLSTLLIYGISLWFLFNKTEVLK